MANTYNNQNLLQDSVVFGTFTNCDVVAGGTQANAKFKRNVLIGGDLTLGLETSTTTNGVTTYTDISGNIKFKINGVSYTITPTILSYLTTINSNIQTQINNIISSTGSGSSYVDLSTAQNINGIKSFLSIPVCSATYPANDNTTNLSTTAFTQSLLNKALFTTTTTTTYPNVPFTDLTTITGLTNWYDASNPNGNGTIPTNGQTIYTWVGKSPDNNNNNNMIAIVAGAYATNSLNGLGTMSFNYS